MSNEEQKEYLVRVMAIATQQYLDDPSEDNEYKIEAICQNIAIMGRILASAQEANAFASKLLVPIELMYELEHASTQSILDGNMNLEENVWQQITEVARNTISDEELQQLARLSPRQVLRMGNVKSHHSVGEIHAFLIEPSENSAERLNEWVKQLGRVAALAEIGHGANSLPQR